MMKRGLMVLALAAAAAMPAAAQSLDAVFDAYLLGVRAGTLTVSGSEGGGRYEASARVRSSGLVSVIAKYSFAAASKGRVRGPLLLPESYAERSDTGKRTSDRQVVWRDGVPEIVKSSKSRSYYLDPAAQAGTTDPMTAIFATLRDQTRAELCQLDMAVFDGARRVQITLSDPRANSPTITCRGLYRRVGGFSDGQMKDGGDFPFTVTYAPDGDRFRAVSIDLTTVRGRAQFVRR